ARILPYLTDPSFLRFDMRLEEVKWAAYLPYDRGTESEDYEREFIIQLKLCILGSNYSALSSLILQLERQVGHGIQIAFAPDACQPFCILY
ncbi:hypothetical protein GGI05_003315, partial [Coemansia sp. RSA 2603]